MENTISRIIAELHERYRHETGGTLADYIPELTQTNPDWFGISIMTTDGHQYEVGDTREKFTIQSISKAFIYGMILDEHGPEKVDTRIGVEPSGDTFNSIRLDPETGRPPNPMINAGAIAATGMVTGTGLENRYEKVRSCFSRYAGEELTLDESVYKSESSTGFRNRAIANLLRNFGKLDDPVDESLELYFKQCSIEVTCADLAVMAGSLANSGVNPMTGERVIKQENVEKVLSVMSTCGMYDHSGKWIFNVGLPAKSGVGGGIIGVLPGQMSIAVFSPLLDPKGSSVRGVKTFQEISRRFKLHLLNSPVMSDQCIRRVYRLNEVGSHNQRRSAHLEAIRQHGGAVLIAEMQGDLFFTAVERLVRAQSELSEETHTLIVDLSRTGLIGEATKQLVCRVAEEICAEGRSVIFVDPKKNLHHYGFKIGGNSVIFVDGIELALGYCEDEIIREHVETRLIGGCVPLHEFDLLDSMSSAELSTIEALLGMETFPKGATISAQGSELDSIYFLASGAVGIFHVVENGTDAGKIRRVAVLNPGVCFGDLGAIGESLLSSDYIADKDSTCFVLSIDALGDLENSASEIYVKLIRNILKANVTRLRKSDGEIASLKG